MNGSVQTLVDMCTGILYIQTYTIRINTCYTYIYTFYVYIHTSIYIYIYMYRHLFLFNVYIKYDAIKHF